MTEREALKSALVALEEQVRMANGWQSPAEAKAITAIKKALAQPEQEPVGWYDSISGGMDFTFYKPHRKPSSPSAEWIPVYSRPPQRKPLTEDEVVKMDEWLFDQPFWRVLMLVRAIEAAHGIKE